MAETLKLKTEPFPMRVVVDETSREAVTTRYRQQLQTPYVVLCPFTTRPQKHWPMSHWLALIEQLASRGDIHCVLLGGPGDTASAHQLDSDAVLNAVGETSLLEATALIQNAELVIGVDTGLTHIGIASRTPTIALFGSTCPYLESPGSPLEVIYIPRSCSPCRRRPSCNNAFDCMQEITPVRVMQSVQHFVPQP